MIFELYLKTFKNVDGLWNCSIVVMSTFWRYRNETSRTFAMKHSVVPSISGTNACLNNECKNGGLCQKKNSTYLCQCLPGFTGRNCEGKSVLMYAQTNAISVTSCLRIMGNFCFFCFFVFVFVVVEDHCYSQPCLNNGSCENSANGYQCKCVMGFQGHNCQGEGINFTLKTSIKQEYMHQKKCQV